MMTVRQKQCLLTYLGYDCGGIDGLWGPKSEAATKGFQKNAGLDADGSFGTETEKAILAAVCGGEDAWSGIRHFSRGEFACKCGKCGGFPTEPDMTLVRKADALRAHLGAPIHVFSGVRCKSHNAAVGGVSNSRHLTGKAMDFRAEGFSSAQTLARVNLLGGIRYAYAIDGNFVHMDVL